MDTFSAYVFRQALNPVLAILAALTAVAVLTQGFNQLDLLSTDRSGILAFIWITLLTLPQVIGLILPFAVFAGITQTIARMRREGEIAVAQGAGLSLQGISRPLLQLAWLAAVVHLSINCLVQPAAFREIRHALYSVRTDLVAGLIREGDFTYPAPGLTLYARARGPGGQMRDVMIDDARGPHEITYTARTGVIQTVAGAPAFVMVTGQIQRQRPDGALDVIDFDRFALPLGLSFSEPPAFYLKPSDRYLSELFFPDLTTHYDQHNVRALQSEGHARLASPLLDVALAFIAIVGGLSGQDKRRGYFRQIALAAAIAVVVRLAAIGVQAGAVNQPLLNWLGYLIPIVTIALSNAIIAGPGSTPRSDPRIKLRIAEKTA